jgi:hypothetical protein
MAATGYPPADLGALLRRAQASTIGAWIAFGAGMAILLVWVVLSVLLAVDQASRGASRGTIIAGLIGVFVFLVPLGAIFARKGWTGRLYRFDLHEHGAVYEEHAGRTEIRWSELSSVFWEELQHEAELGLGLSVGTHRTAKLSLVPMRGKTIAIDEKLPDHVALAALVRDTAEEAMLPRYEAALAAGQRVFFGSVGVDAHGIHTPRLMLPWESVAFVRGEQSGASAWYAVYGHNDACLTTFDTKGLPNEMIFQVVLTRFGKLGQAAHERSVGARLAGAVQNLLARRSR